MTLLLFNYAIFNNPTLVIIGWIIAGIEAITAILQFFKVVFRNNKKIVERLDKSIEKCQNTIARLQAKRIDYQNAVAYESINNRATNLPVDVIIPPADGVENIEPEHIKEPDAEIDEINKECDAALAEHEKADFDAAESVDIEPDAESYELFKKIYRELKKND